MKTKILIIEDNDCKFFATKQVLEAQLKLKVNVVRGKSDSDVSNAADDVNPDIVLFRPEGGIASLVAHMRRRNFNRRNTEVTLLVTQEVDDDLAKRFREFLADTTGKRIAEAA